MKLITNLLGAALMAIASVNVQAQGYELRDDAKEFARDLEVRHRIPEAETLAILARASYDERVIRYIRPPQKSGVRSWQRYRARFVEPIRIQAGIEFWEDNRETVRAAAQRFAVDEAVIVGIIGVETIYGRYIGNFQLLDALATLAFDYPPRAELFRRELENLFLMAQEQGRAPDEYYGSFAGAIGLPQFLPSSIRNYAVDFDGDGRIDLENSIPDAIGSVANYLHVHGWRLGEPVAVPAVVLDGARVDKLIAAGIEPSLSRQRLVEAGVIPRVDDQTDQPATLVDLVSPGSATEYWLGYRNFYVITRYNRSSFYAMSVFQLAEAINRRMDAKIARRN